MIIQNAKGLVGMTPQLIVQSKIYIQNVLCVFDGVFVLEPRQTVNAELYYTLKM